MSTNRKTYTEEFKQEAVSLLGKSDNKSQVARDLGVHASLLKKWQKKIKQYGERPFPGKGKPQDEELSQLRKENSRLKEEVEILKKAVGIFSSRPRQHTGSLMIIGGSTKCSVCAVCSRHPPVDSYAWKKYKATTDSNRQLPVHENKLNRSFEVTTPNTAWAADLTYIWTAEGWLYLAVVIDLFSRKGIGWYDVRDYGEKACSRCPHHGSGAKKSMRRNPSPFGSWHPVCKQGLIRRYSIKPASLAA